MKKGISLVVLVISLAVVIVLAATITITATNVYNNTKKAKFASELVYVQELVNTYKLNNNGDIPTEKIIYIDISDVLEEDISEQFKDETIKNNQLHLYQIDFSELNSKELFYGNSKNSDSEDIYCYSRTTGKVYYISGLKIGGKTYYTLTDDLKNSINYVEDNNVNDGILFVYNNTFNNKGEIDIKIPINYTDVSITSTDNNFTTENSNDNKYVTYKTISDINSVITISYKKVVDGEIKQIKYIVENIDKEAPTFEISDVKTMLNSENGKEEKYIQIENLSDNLSGVKMVKYSNNLFFSKDYAKEYFKNKGTNITEKNIIELGDNIFFITVYVEDNAGNYTIKYYDSGNFNNYITDGLILHYDGIQNTRDGYNPNTTLWEDLSGNNNDGNFINSNNTITYKENGYEFTNNSDYIETTNTLNLSTDPDVTIEIVYKWYGFQDGQTLAGLFTTSNFQAINGYSLIGWFRSDGITLSTVNVRVTASAADINKINSSSFVKKSGTFNTNNVIIYNNAEEESFVSSANAATMNFQDATLQIGRGWKFGTQNRTLNGIIYSVRVYDRVLTEEEIKHNYEIDKVRFNLE